MIKVDRCDKRICRVIVPYTTLVLVPHSDVFEPITFFILKKYRAKAVIEIPRGSILRVGKTPHAKYYLIDGEPIQLKGTRAKLIGLNTWGWHYKNPKTGEHVATIIYLQGKFIRLHE